MSNQSDTTSSWINHEAYEVHQWIYIHQDDYMDLKIITGNSVTDKQLSYQLYSRNSFIRCYLDCQNSDAKLLLIESIIAVNENLRKLLGI